MSGPRKSVLRQLLIWSVSSAIVAVIIALLVFAYRNGHQEATEEEEQEHPSAAQSAVGVASGETFITLDQARQLSAGLETTTLRATTQQQQTRTNAVVVSVQSLTQLRASYLSDLAQADKAKAALAVSEREYQRLKGLHDDNENVAAKAVEAAEGESQSDQVTVRSANEALQLNDALARQTWGAVIANWIKGDAPEMERVLNQNDALLQVSLSSQLASSPPQNVALQLPSGKIQTAQFVSAYPAVDPRIQSPSFLYLTPSATDMSPGMTLMALVGDGRSMRGVVVPSDAAVWWQGKAWAYVQTAADRFTRREVPTDVTVSGGWFASSGFLTGQRVVVKGAQQLLSEEFRSQIQSLEESGEEEDH